MTPETTVSLCRDAGDLTKPCPFVSVCSAARQDVQSHEGLRGNRCWAFPMIARRRPDLLRVIVVGDPEAA